MKAIQIAILLLLLCSNAYAGKISSPPPMKDKATYQYLKILYDNFNNLENVTTNPDGVRNGRIGDAVLLFTGGNYYLEICVSSPEGKVWMGVQLTNTP